MLWGKWLRGLGIQSAITFLKDLRDIHIHPINRRFFVVVQGLGWVFFAV